MIFNAFARIMAAAQPRLASVNGVRLRSPGEGVWLAERELVYRNAWRLPVRMVLLEHAPGALTCYSPLPLDAGTLEAVAGLGEVCLIVAPNRFHTAFTEQACRHFPAARVLAPAVDGDLSGRLQGQLIRVDGEFSLGRQTMGTVVSARSGFEEVVLYHDRAELLVVSDLLFNLTAQQLDGRLLRWLARGNGVLGRPSQLRLQRRLVMRDRAGLEKFYRWAMSRPFAQISMAHGQLVTDNARETFYQLFHQYAAS